MKTVIRTVRRVFSTLIVGVFAMPAAFAEESLEDLLVKKGLITTKDLETLDGGEREANKGDEDLDTNDLVEVSVGYRGLAIKTRDDKFTFAFGGRLQFDAGLFIQDDTKLGDGTEVRRGRIKLYGTVWSKWDYKLEVNFDPDLGVPITDGWLRYSGYKPFAVTVGHQKVPFSQSSMTSSNWQVFQERALSDAFIDNEEQGRRRMGVVLASHGDMWSYSGGVFSGGLDDSNGEDEDIGTGHRIVFAPIAEKTRVAAIGGSVIYREFNGRSSLRFRARPESHLSGAHLVDTGVLATSQDIVMYNFETTVVAGPFHGQAEYTAAHVWRGGGQDDLDFSGFYVQAGVFLTGESRNYDQKSGKYKRVMPTRKSLGAWELAARFSQIDLSSQDLRGGVQRDVTAALNWWANANVMFRLNYVYGNADPNSGVTLAGQNEHIHAFTTRA
ncbi:MAG: porin, partial [Gammaproteobacteria bacterium]|nr:porin [Gammaproteobacteria bacterium]